MKIKLLVICFFLFSNISSIEALSKKEKTICLNMIVKNESMVIERCLESVRPIIDYWVIVDTGSSDGTQEIIKEYMKDIPGELYESPWVNFEHNRNEALQLAKGKADYVLFIDADERLVYEKDFILPPLDKDFYFITSHLNGTIYPRIQLLRDNLNCVWKGVLHEAIDCSHGKTYDTLAYIFNEVHTDGARSQDPEKFKKDAKVLEEALRLEPDNSRYVFYLAQSYKDAKDYNNSILYYQKRIEMGGWQEEVFWSMLQVGLLEQLLNDQPGEFIQSLMKAYSYRPTRIEPLYYLAHYFQTIKNYEVGYQLSKIAANTPVPNDIIFIQKWMYDYGALLELSICAYWIGEYEESAIACRRILQVPNLPTEIEDCAKRNLEFANIKLVTNRK